MTNTHHFVTAKRFVLSGRRLSGDRLDRFVADVAQAQGADVACLLEGAHQIRLKFMGHRVDLCAIVNAKSGRCSENCSFCAQSGHYQTDAPEHPFLDVSEILQAAHGISRLGAMRIGIVTSGKTPTGADFDKLAQAVTAVAGTGLLADASCGILEHSDRSTRRGLCLRHGAPGLAAGRAKRCPPRLLCGSTR